VPKIVIIGEVLTKLLQKWNGAVFLPHMVVFPSSLHNHH